MKLSLSIKIILKDFFPKWNSVPFENFVCLVNYNNNFTSQIKFSDLPEQNFIIHKVESYNSNIIYNFHVLDSNKISLIGGCNLCINFDKIKNLNINDILKQEGNYKLIIDAITKRKFFDNITNMGDIYLTIATEVKVLNKKLYDPNKYKKYLFSLNNENINGSNIRKINNSFLNIIPSNLRKNQFLNRMKNACESLKLLKSFNENSEFETNINNLNENYYNTFYQCPGIKKHKSSNKAKVNLKNIITYNNKQNIFNNSSTELMSPNHFNTNYSKNNKVNAKRNRISFNKNKAIALNLMDQKIDKVKFNQNVEDIFKSNKLQNNCYKTQKGKSLINKDYKTFNNLNFGIKEKEIGKSFGESDFFKRKDKTKIPSNNFEKNEISTERKLNNKKNLGLIDYTQMSTEIMNNNKLISHKKHLSINNNVNNIFLQTEPFSSTAEKVSHNKICLHKDILKNLKQLITDKNKFQKNILLEQTRGTFSPKLSLKEKLDQGVLLTEANENIKTRNKERLSKRMMTPKGNKIKYIDLAFTNEKNKNKMNEELRKKFFGIIACYSLLIQKIKSNYENNIEFAKKLNEIKERCNNLNKYKNKLVNLKNLNESKKIINHTLHHFEEEKLITKLTSIKLKENSINELIFGETEKNGNTIDKINMLISQKKKTFVNLIKNVVKYYGNISQIFNNDNDKKNKLIKVLEKYDIEEKNKTNLNYINYMHEKNNFNDKIITEVDEDKENEEEYEEHNCRNKNLILDSEFLIDNHSYNNITSDDNNIQEIKISIPNLNKQKKNQIIFNKDEDNNYDEDLNNLIEKILIEQFPEKYNTELRFVLLEQNKYLFNNNIFLAYIENNDIILKDEYNENKYSLDDFYNNFCKEDKIEYKNNFIYTKKIRQKYIKIKSYEDNESNTDKKMRNENNTTMDTDFIQQSIISKGNEISEEKI